MKSNLYNFFFKKNQRSKLPVLPILKVYTLHSFTNEYKTFSNKKFNFLQFFTRLYLARKFIKATIRNDFAAIYFILFYKAKTFNLISLSNNFFNKNHALPGVTRSNSYYNTGLRIRNFWKKWKDLKRPVELLNSPDDFETFYITKVAAKYSIYNYLGLLRTTQSHFIRYVRHKKVDTNIRLNKELLLSPKFSSSNIGKYFQIKKLDGLEFQYLRKNKVYNKGRYSRCRQNYRTGVYMCMYLSVISILGLYYWFYKFSFNFSYLWWLFIAFFASFFLPKIIKYRLYEPVTLLTKFFNFFKWCSNLIKSFF
jgi:hypothetical protein